MPSPVMDTKVEETVSLHQEDSDSDWKIGCADEAGERVVAPDRTRPSARDSGAGHENQRISSSEIIVKIVSAQYGPCEGRRIPLGGLDRGDEETVPYTRDVTPFLRALLIARRCQETASSDLSDEREFDESSSGASDTDTAIVRLSAVAGKGGMRRARIPLLDGMKSTMNSVFGDPCPGTSKRLYVDYLVTESDAGHPGLSSRLVRAASTESYHVSFFENETVVLRRNEHHYREDQQIREATARLVARTSNADTGHKVSDYDEKLQDESTLLAARRMGRTQSIAEFAEEISSLRGLRLSASKATLLGASLRRKPMPHCSKPGKRVGAFVGDSRSRARPWRLRSSVSEIVLPIVMPFLDVRERVQCQLVCTVWRNVIRLWGVATTIDCNDPAFPRFTRPFFRGLLAYSHSSLVSLVLSGFEDLEKSDFHPSVPHLQKLKFLDVTRCVLLDDSTMKLLAEYSSQTLEVLYIKGLRKVTDEGVTSIAQACSRLQVLEVSNVPITDKAGLEIGKNMTELRAFYMRDNYQLTNRSIDVITERCTQMQQLTLWGCTRLKKLNFGLPGGNLRMLNLWGCHGLQDDCAQALEGMTCLQSLVVTECHKLTDAFLASLCEHVPQLHHLHLRFCKLVTDVGIRILAQGMRDLYSLDLTFCSRVTSASISDLLRARHSSLSELRLRSCTTLDIGTADNRRRRNLVDPGSDGRVIVEALNATGTGCCLSLLDVRQCGGQPGRTGFYADHDPFVGGMKSLGFEQRVAGYFGRAARWNQAIETRLVQQFLSDIQ